MNKRIQKAISAAANKVVGHAEDDAPEKEDDIIAEENNEDQPDAEGGDMPADDDPDAEGDDMPADDGEEDDDAAPDAAVASERKRCAAIVKQGMASNQMPLACVLIEEGTSANQSKTIFGSIAASAPDKGTLAGRMAASQGSKRPGSDHGAGKSAVGGDLASVASKQFPKRVNK